MSETYEVDGVSYYRDSAYRDADGDVWYFVGGGPWMGDSCFASVADSSPLQWVVDFHGPLTRV